MKALAIGAHPDDVELGCGATLALMKERGHEIYLLVMTRGEASGDPMKRTLECQLSADILKADELFFADLPDTKISEGIESISKIEHFINKVKPDFVFCHSPKDGHQDHRNTGLATIAAARNVGRVLLYESPAAARDFLPQVFVNVDSTFPVKLEALQSFGSQASKIYFKGNSYHDESRKFPYVSNAIEGLARYRGFQAGVALAEAFEAGRFLLEIDDVKKQLLQF